MPNEKVSEQETTKNELVFKSDEEKTVKLEELQDRVAEGETIDSSELDRISNAKVVESEEQISEEPAGETMNEEMVEEKTPPPQEQTLNRNFVITEEMISKELYVDSDGVEKPIFSFKDPEKGAQQLVDSYMSSQRRIRHLEDRVEKAIDEGKQSVSKQYKEEIEKLKREVDQAKQTTIKPELTNQTHVASAQETTSEDAFSKMQNALNDLKAVNTEDTENYDPLEHNKKFHAFALAQGQVIQELANKNKGLDEFRVKTETAETKRQETETQRENREKEEKREKEKEEGWVNTCKELDTFVKKEKLDVGGFGFAQMTNGAMKFHHELAQIHTGQQMVTREQIDNAVAAYRMNTPEIANQMKAAGFTAPSYYDKWSYLDQLDALKNGYLIDPATKQWKHRTDIRFPSIDSAQREFKAITGQDKLDIRRAKADGAQEVVNDMNQRDKGVIQMDASRTHEQPPDMGVSEEQARTHLESINTNDVVAEAMIGNIAPLNEFNRARQRLGMPSIKLEDIGVAV